MKLMIGKPNIAKAAEAQPRTVEIPKPDRKTVQGPDVNRTVPGNIPVKSTAPNGEYVVPFEQRGFYYGG